MKVITNQGEYATVTKVMSNHFEIRCDNGVTKLIEKHRCEELVPISRVKEAEKNLHNLQEKHVKVATEIHKLHFELGEQIEVIESREDLSNAQLADRYRCKRVFEKLEKILAI
jgi:vacuolar-type H+-ATPase subunit I/STV1